MALINLVYLPLHIGLILDSTGFAKPKVHAEGRLPRKKPQKIVANDENYALAAYNLLRALSP